MRGHQTEATDLLEIRRWTAAPTSMLLIVGALIAETLDELDASVAGLVAAARVLMMQIAASEAPVAFFLVVVAESTSRYATAAANAEQRADALAAVAIAARRTSREDIAGQIHGRCR